MLFTSLIAHILMCILVQLESFIYSSLGYRYNQIETYTKYSCYQYNKYNPTNKITVSS